MYADQEHLIDYDPLLYTMSTRRSNVLAGEKYNLRPILYLSSL